MSNIKETRQRRKLRVRKNIHGTADMPRVSVFKSAKHCFVQVIDDEAQKTLIGIRDSGEKTKGEKSRWFILGESVGEKLTKKKIKKIVFDRGYYKYGGRLAEIADGIRSKKISF